MMTVSAARTEDLNAATRAAIVDVCIAAHREQDFANLFAYIPSGGRHFLGYDDATLVSHAVVTTRWLQPAGSPRRENCEKFSGEDGERTGLMRV